MKKMIFMLSLMVLSVAGAKAQVTIGSTKDPTTGAVLDLQSSGNKGLLLPHVELTYEDDDISITVQDGLLVCNLTGTLGKGVYYWSASDKKWIAYIKFE